MRYPVYTELNVGEDLQFIFYAFSSHYGLTLCIVFKLCVLLIDKQNESCRFSTWLLMVTVADTANGCQLMSYSQAEKYLKKNENLNLNFE